MFGKNNLKSVEKSFFGKHSFKEMENALYSDREKHPRTSLIKILSNFQKKQIKRRHLLSY